MNTFLITFGVLYGVLSLATLAQILRLTCSENLKSYVGAAHLMLYTIGVCRTLSAFIESFTDVNDLSWNIILFGGVALPTVALNVLMSFVAFKWVAAIHSVRGGNLGRMWSCYIIGNVIVSALLILGLVIGMLQKSDTLVFIGFMVLAAWNCLLAGVFIIYGVRLFSILRELQQRSFRSRQSSDIRQRMPSVIVSVVSTLLMIASVLRAVMLLERAENRHFTDDYPRFYVIDLLVCISILVLYSEAVNAACTNHLDNLHVMDNYSVSDRSAKELSPSSDQRISEDYRVLDDHGSTETAASGSRL
mmetsp:Transcript_11768/g.22676  ORF Transcript_11768/g.22676 Transcript_11768/m.22676 type:complete len:304 (-) Transcript_11768:203-1114(-)